MDYLLALVADLCEVLGIGHQPRRRRAAGQPFGFYPGTHPLVWPNV
jgi:hypothetical protein